MNSQVRTDVTSLLAQAKRLADAHNWSDAADTCRQALELAPDAMEVLDELGWYLSRAKRYEEAIEVYRDLVRRDPNKAKWPYMLGYQYYDQGQWGEAIEWFDRALGLWDSYLVVLYRKGYAHTELNERESAKQAFRKCIDVWRKLDGEARESSAKHYSDACFQLGKILLQGGQSRNAEEILSEAVRYGPPDAHKHYNFGKALLKNGKSSEALRQFQTADQLESDKDYILAYMARAYMDLEDYQQAEATLERIPMRRRKAYVWHDIGKLRLTRSQPQQAIEALVTATKLDPKNHNQYFSLGQAYEACEKPIAAHKAYIRAIELRQRYYDLEFIEAQERLTALEQYASATGIELDGSDEALTLPDGYIRTFKADRGFGFISRDDGADLFFHISDVANPDAIEAGAAVIFQVVDSPKGPRATQVSII
jgi:tetratricopeptide (TPR) repeat protein/cold shock CspA family protein